MTTSDYDAEPTAPEAVPELAAADLDIEAPVADAIEQRMPVAPEAGVGDELPPELPDDVNPADALDQARSVVDPDDDV